MAYGTDVHPDAEEHTGPALEERVGTPGLVDRVARLEKRGIPASELTALRADLDALEAKFAEEEGH
jgi:hypothetical protein